MRKFAIIILETDDIKPREEDKMQLARLIEESLQWWHSYIGGHNDRLELDKWRVYYVEFSDELAIARVLNALGKYREYIKGGLG